MNRTLVALLSVLSLALAPALLAHEADDAAIQKVIDSAYVQGIHNEGNPDKIRAGFDKSFVMSILGDEGVRQITRDEWIERIEAGNAKRDPNEARPETTAKITVIGHEGKAAVAKVEVFRDGKQIFTDFMSLYKFDDGWKLVGKIFHSFR